MDSEGEGCADYSSSGGAAGYGGEKEPYKIVNTDDIRRHVDNDISTVSDVLCVSRGVACTLLCQNNWTLSSVYDQWFAAGADDDTIPEPAAVELGKQACNICYDEIMPQNTASTACSHPFCVDCLKTYVVTAINDGPGCLTLSCPEPGCKAGVGVELVESLADKDKYYTYLYRSYVEGSRKRKWCPGPGCDLAVEFDCGGGGDGGYDVTCGSSHSFCWNSTAEKHHPVGCETASNWIEMAEACIKKIQKAEIEKNMNWILTNTKPCPNCRRPIEKSQGCKHMACTSPCLFQFCWLCKQPWEGHQNCNNNNHSKRDEISVSKSDDQISVKSNKEKRFEHYFQRWYSYEISRDIALANLRQWTDET